MQALECGCQVNVTYQPTDGKTIILVVNVVEWCWEHDTAQCVLLGASGVLMVAKKEAKAK